MSAEPEPGQQARDRARRCQNCDAFVTERYIRVFGDNSGTLHSCPECASFRHRANGAGAGLEEVNRL